MRRISTAIALLAIATISPAMAQTAAFDGTWSVTQECEPAPGGARGFKWAYDATVTGGRARRTVRHEGQALVADAHRTDPGRRLGVVVGVGAQRQVRVHGGLRSAGREVQLSRRGAFRSKARHGPQDPDADVPLHLREALNKGWGVRENSHSTRASATPAARSDSAQLQIVAVDCRNRSVLFWL